MSDMLLSAEHLTLGYEGKSVIEDISFCVHAGDYLAIVGDNGAGKSTLVKAILGLISPMSGRIEYHGGLRHDEIGYLPQQSSVQKVFPASVEEVVSSGLISTLGHRLFPGAEDRRRVRRNLERFGMYENRRKSYQELSGGQQQKVLLARAFTAAGRMLLLDEPVSGLDPHSSYELYRTIDSLNSSGCTIIMVTHDIHPALNSASHVLHIGESTFFGTKDEYFRSQEGMNFIKEAGCHV